MERKCLCRSIADAIQNDGKKMDKLCSISNINKRREKAYNYVVGVAREFGVKLTEDEIFYTAWRTISY